MRVAMTAILWLTLFCGAARAGRDEGSIKTAQAVLADAQKSLSPEASADVLRSVALLGQFYAEAGDAPRLAEMDWWLSGVKSKNFEAWMALAQLQRFQDKSREAADALGEALALRPDEPEAERELAIVDQNLGRDEEAARLFQKAIKRTPDNNLLYIWLGRSDMRLGRVAEAKEAFAQAKKIKGKTVDDYVAEGYFHLDSGEVAEAKSSFENAISVDTGDPAGYHHMGSFYSSRGQHAEAEKYFRLALDRLEANPKAEPLDLLHTLDWLGDVVRMQGRDADAEEIYRRCAAKSTSRLHYPNCFMELGRMYAARGKNGEAEDIFKEAAASCGDGSPCLCRGAALLGLGNLYLKQDRRREAADLADQAGELCSVYRFEPPLLMDLAALYMSLGEVAKGEAFYRRIDAGGQAMPSNSVVPFAQTRMAELEMARGRFHEAEELYRQAIPILTARREDLRVAAAFEGLAAACEKGGKPREAADAREKAKVLKTSALNAPALPSPP